MDRGAIQIKLNREKSSIRSRLGYTGSVKTPLGVIKDWYHPIAKMTNAYKTCEKEQDLEMNQVLLLLSKP